MDVTKVGVGALKFGATRVWRKNLLDRFLEAAKGRENWPDLNWREHRRLLACLGTADFLDAFTDQTDVQTTTLASLIKAKVLAPQRTEDEAKTMAEILVAQYPGALDPPEAFGLLALGLRQIKADLAATQGAGAEDRGATNRSLAKAIISAQLDSVDDPPLVNADVAADIYGELQLGLAPM